MAKRYYWLKLKEDFFDDDTISWIEEQPNGKEYCLFYLKLCLKSLKTDGVLIRTVGDILVPYDIKKLAELTRTDFDTAAVAMNLFQKIGLVQVLENGEIYLAQLSQMVGSETDKAEMMRRARAAKNIAGNNVTKALPERYTEKEKELEKENRDKEIEKEQEETPRKAAKPARHKYGEYSNVLLSDEELQKLQAEFPADWQARIERLSGYIASTGKKYKNHLATIRNWARSDKEKGQRKTSGKDAEKMPRGELPF